MTSQYTRLIQEYEKNAGPLGRNDWYWFKHTRKNEGQLTDELLRFTEDPTMWFNLHSNRSVQGSKENVSSIRNIRIFGSIDELKVFWLLNITYLERSIPKGSRFEQSIIMPFSDIKYITDEMVRATELCRIGDAGTIIPYTGNTDVRKLSKDQISNLCRFSFIGLFMEVVIANIYDGDTLDIVGFVPMTELGSAKKIGNVKEAQTAALLPAATQGGFFAKINLRMHGYDAIEKSHPNSERAVTELKNKFASLNNIVWCLIVDMIAGKDKYGRMLAHLFEDKDKKIRLNDFLINRGKELNIELAKPYTGGTKEAFN